MRQLRRHVVVLVVVTALSGCGGGSDPQIACEEVSPAALAGIEESLTVDGGGSISAAAAVRAPERENVFFVAAEIDGPGIEGEGDIGVWATNDITTRAAWFSVDAVAKEFSTLTDGEASSAEISPTENGVDDARNCLGEQ